MVVTHKLMEMPGELGYREAFFMDTMEAPQLEHLPVTEQEVIEKVILSAEEKISKLTQLQIMIIDFELKKIGFFNKNL